MSVLGRSINADGVLSLSASISLRSPSKLTECESDQLNMYVGVALKSIPASGCAVGQISQNKLLGFHHDLQLLQIVWKKVLGSCCLESQRNAQYSIGHRLFKANNS